MRLGASRSILMLSGDSSVAQGKETIFFQMLGEFSRYWERVDVICPRAPGAEERTVHGNVHVHPGDRHYLLHPRFVSTKGRQLFAEHPFDLITDHNYPPFVNNFGARALTRALDVPHIIELMHVTGYPVPDGLEERLHRLAFAWYLRRHWRAARGIRVINLEVAGFLASLGIPGSIVLYIPAFHLDLEVYRPKRGAGRGDTILYCGRLDRNKGLIETLDAFGLVQRERPDARLVICGDGPLRGRVHSRARSLGVAGRIIFDHTFPMPPAELARQYSEADVLVMASSCEGGPRVTLEAMACGTPVVSTRVGVMPEVVVHGENGLFTTRDPRDIARNLLRLLDDAELRARMGRRAADSVQRFEKRAAIERYARTYLELIGS